MLTKLDIRSCRVKGLSFHPTSPWILCGMHSGAIQIWDYRMNTSVGTYEEHVGSVRGVDFHSSQPLFVSGADDYLIKVWNYQLCRCLFTLEGHMDYIRCTFFHRTQPWILSCSDDFTVRIWNWQNRSLVASLPGHNHYVLCAQFHPRQDLIVSASLDTTIRVWDISALLGSRQKAGLTQDLLGSSDVILRYQLDGHEMGVNWAAFHPTSPLIVSASDDRSVRVWRMSGPTCREEVQLRGHTNNVCCVQYYKDFIISNSEDRTIRVWDVNSRSAIMVFRRDADRYWMLAVHPTNNLIAAGHDSGVQVFKLFRERPAWVMHNGALYYLREQTLHMYDFKKKNDEKIMSFRVSQSPPVSLTCNPADNTAIASYNVDDGMQTLFTIPKPGSGEVSNNKTAYYKDAVFFSSNKFAMVDKNNAILTRSTGWENPVVLATDFKCARIFPGPIGHLVCRSIDEKMYLYDMSQKCAVAKATVTDVRYVVWTAKFEKVAFLSKNCITVMSKKFNPITVILESTVRIKSAAFDELENVLYYTTANHLKYCNLHNGECSTIRTLVSPIYLVRARGNEVMFLDRAGKLIEEKLDNTELSFKLMLQKGEYSHVLDIIQKKKLKGQALVGYLYKHGHSEIALHFVSDPITRFNLAIECGAIETAKATATEINKPEVWRRLAETATRFGDIQLAQHANGKINNYYGMGMQCILTHNISLLEKIVETSKDRNFKIHYSLYTNDVMQRVKTLEEAGQLPLAYAAAKSNGLEEEAAALLEKMEPAVAERAMQIPLHKPLKRPSMEPVLENWPMLKIAETRITRMLRDPNRRDIVAEPTVDDDEEGDAWGSDDDLYNLKAGKKGGSGEEEENNGGGGDEGDGWDDDLEVLAPKMSSSPAAGASKKQFVVPEEGRSAQSIWVHDCRFAPYHIASGSFEEAYRLLKDQIGLINPEPLHPYMMNMYMSITASQPVWLGQSDMFSLATQPMNEDVRVSHVPMIPDPIPGLRERIQLASEAFVRGSFAEAHGIYQSMMHIIAIATVSSINDSTLQDMLEFAGEYVQALNVQLTLRAAVPDSVEAVELALYFTEFQLNREHMLLAVGQAMAKAYKKGAFKAATCMASRQKELNPPRKKREIAENIIAEAGVNPTDAVTLNFDGNHRYKICSVDKKPLTGNLSDTISCSYCKAPAHKKYEGKECAVCGIASYGKITSGRVNVPK